MNKSLVTGGAGYKGILLVKHLLDLGHHVTLVDNFMYGFDSVLHLSGEKNLEIIKLDIRNIESRDLLKYDTVFHLAGISGMPACAANPSSAEFINVQATRLLASKMSKSQQLIYASTTSIYGDASSYCDENVHINPPSLYAKTKYEAEQIVMERTNSVSLRFATIFGTSPRMRADLLVNDFTYKAINERSIVIFGSKSKRTFLHIKDAIEGYIFAFNNFNTMKDQVYNLGDENLNFSKINIAEAIKKHIDFEIIDSSLPDLDIRDFIVSFSKIKNLGYNTKRTLDDGICDLLKLYRFYKVYSHFNTI